MLDEFVTGRVLIYVEADCAAVPDIEMAPGVGIRELDHDRRVEPSWLKRLRDCFAFLVPGRVVTFNDGVAFVATGREVIRHELCTADIVVGDRRQVLHGRIRLELCLLFE